MIEYTVTITKAGGTSVYNVTAARREQNPPAELVATSGTFAGNAPEPEGDCGELSEWLRGRGVEVFGPNAIISGRRFGCRVRTNMSGAVLARTNIGMELR